MSDDINIEGHERNIASLNFDRSPRSLNARCRASGFTLRLPASIKIERCYSASRSS